MLINDKVMDVFTKGSLFQKFIDAEVRDKNIFILAGARKNVFLRRRQVIETQKLNKVDVARVMSSR